MTDKPVIKTFLYKEGFFMYTPYSNHILQVTQNHFKELKELEFLGINAYLHQNRDNPEYQDIISLIESCFITGPFIEEVKHPATDDYITITNRSVQRLVLQVTQKCNFACRYCHNIHSRSARFLSERSDMSWEVAKQSVDFFINHSQDSETVDIYFYGGEPLLNFPLIKRVVEYTEMRINTKEVTYHITTNASLLTENIATFLETHKFKMAVSLDGNNERQNWARKFANGNATFDVVWKNVQMPLSAFREHPEDVMFLPVVFVDEDKKSVQEFFKANGINQNQILFLNANTSGVDYSHGVLQAKIGNKGVIDTEWVNYDSIGDDEFHDFLKKYSDKRGVGKTWHHAGTCIPGYFKIFINTKGQFYPCENAPECPDICIGDVSNGINSERAINLLNIGALTKNECVNCWAMRFCSMCALFCIDEEKQCINREIKQLNCDAFKKHAIKLLRKYVDYCYQGGNDG